MLFIFLALHILAILQIQDVYLKLEISLLLSLDNILHVVFRNFKPLLLLANILPIKGE